MNFLRRRISMIRFAILQPYTEWQEGTINIFTKSKAKYIELGVPLKILYIAIGIFSPILAIIIALSALESFVYMINYMIQGIIFGNIFIGFSEEGNPLIVRWKGDS